MPCSTVGATIVPVQPQEAQTLATRDQQIVLERQRGDTITEIGKRHGISHQRVSVVTSNAMKFVCEVRWDLKLADPDEACVFVIPYSPDYTPGARLQHLADHEAARDGHGSRRRNPARSQRPGAASYRHDPTEGLMTFSTIARRDRLADVKQKLSKARADRTQAARLREEARKANERQRRSGRGHQVGCGQHRGRDQRGAPRPARARDRRRQQSARDDAAAGPAGAGQPERDRGQRSAPLELREGRRLHDRRRAGGANGPKHPGGRHAPHRADHGREPRRPADTGARPEPDRPVPGLQPGGADRVVDAALRDRGRRCLAAWLKSQAAGDPHLRRPVGGSADGGSVGQDEPSGPRRLRRRQRRPAGGRALRGPGQARKSCWSRRSSAPPGSRHRTSRPGPTWTTPSTG